MRLTVHDTEDFTTAIDPNLVEEVMGVLAGLPLYVKQSDQKGKQDRLIFDPVGTNAAIASALSARGWTPKIPIPDGWQALGIDIDFGKNGLLVEAQFSNYPFLLNNVIRTNVLHESGVDLESMGAIKAAIIITKCKLIEASNSTLYTEQAVEQLRFLEKGNTLDVPVRIVGLSVERGEAIDAVVTAYHAKRYSRTPVSTKRVKCRLGGKGVTRERERIVVIGNTERRP